MKNMKNMGKNLFTPILTSYGWRVEQGSDVFGMSSDCVRMTHPALLIADGKTASMYNTVATPVVCTTVKPFMSDADLFCGSRRVINLGLAFIGVHPDYLSGDIRLRLLVTGDALHEPGAENLECVWRIPGYANEDRMEATIRTALGFLEKIAKVVPELADSSDEYLAECLLKQHDTQEDPLEAYIAKLRATWAQRLLWAGSVYDCEPYQAYLSIERMGGGLLPHTHIFK